MNIIEEIFHGKIRPFEEICKTIPDFSEFAAKVIKKSEDIKETLSEEQLCLFVEYDEILEELHLLCEKQCFVEGFKIGAKLQVEIFQEKI